MYIGQKLQRKLLCAERQQLYKRHDVITISKTLYTRPTYKELVEVANN